MILTSFIFSWPIVLLILGTFVYLKLRTKYRYWSSRGINGPSPWPLLGTIPAQATSDPKDLELEWQRRYGQMYGIYLGWKPSLVITSAELTRQVLIRDFPYFINRSEANWYHEVVSHNLFQLKSDNWKRVRSIATPSFSSGKLRGMYGLMERAVDKLEAHFDRLTPSGSADFDARQSFFNFTMDVIATTGFALEINSNDSAGKQSPFVTLGNQLFRIPAFKFLAAFTLPRAINNLLGIHFAPPAKPTYFFLDLAHKIVQERKRNGVRRDDLVQLMLDAYQLEGDDIKSQDYATLTATEHETSPETAEIKPKAGAKIKRKTLSEAEIVGNIFFFFTAGFETTGGTLSYCAYELAKNPCVQARLFTEIQSKLVNIERGSEEYFEVVQHGIPYLEAVIKETLRKYPPLVRLERCLEADGYVLGGVPLERGQSVMISTVAVHYNPEYYPNPECFNPERFLPENRHLLTPYTYIPFGDGPRNCVGMRFAYQELKLCLAHIVSRYRFDRAPNTPDKLCFTKGNVFLTVNEIPLKLVKRHLL